MQTLVTLLLYMSISGSVFFLVYLLSNLLTRERFTASFRYFLLKLCALVFLVPLPLIKHLVQVWLFSVNMTSPLTKEYYFFDVSHSFNLTDTGIYFPRMENYQKLLLGFWVGIMVFMILLQLHRFYIFSRNIRQYLSPAHDCDCVSGRNSVFCGISFLDISGRLSPGCAWNRKVYGLWLYEVHDEKYDSACRGYVVCRKDI